MFQWVTKFRRLHVPRKTNCVKVFVKKRSFWPSIVKVFVKERIAASIRFAHYSSSFGRAAATVSSSCSSHVIASDSSTLASFSRFAWLDLVKIQQQSNGWTLIWESAEPNKILLAHGFS